MKHSLRSFLVRCLLVLGLVSCSGGDGGDGGAGDQEPEPSGIPAAVASVTVTPEQATMEIGQSSPFTATLQDENGNSLSGRTIVWSTSNDAIATVSTTGSVTAIATGSATITATSEGRSDSASVTVATASVVIYSSVVTGGAHSCALTATTGEAYCWGRGESGQLGVSPPDTTCVLDDGGTWPCSLIPVAVGGGRTFERLITGGAHTCGLAGNGSAYCWGDNSSGQLGNGSTDPSTLPDLVAGGLAFVSIDAGASHTCALTNGGVGYCWGANERGQLGDGTTTNRWSPVVVSGGHTFEALSAGGFSIGQTCGIEAGGAAYCWGDNERGQLGIGSRETGPHPVPTAVSGALKFVELSTGLGRHTCGVTTSGAGYCWGENSFGALGDGSQSDSSVPVAVSGGLVFSRLIAGGFIGHTCGLTTDATAYCWGDNEVGALGDGTTIDRLEPTLVSGGRSFDSLDAGFRHTCGVAVSGIVYCWGRGAAGQLGRNSTEQSVVPVRVVGQE